MSLPRTSWEVSTKPRITCACGCGLTLTQFDVKGRPRRFINGHNNRTTPVPMGRK